MNKTAQKHLDAIRAGAVAKTNVIGLRKLLNASVREATGWSISTTACVVDLDDLDTIVSAIGEHRPRVIGELHESGLAVLRNPRYAKRLQWQRSFIGRIDHFRLVRFDGIGRREDHYVPVYSVHDAAGSHLFTFRNIPWQSGGDGPEIQGGDF